MYTIPSPSSYRPRLHPSSLPQTHPRFLETDIAEETGPLDVLRGRRVLVLADIENLSFGAKKSLGYKVSYAALGERLTRAATHCALHAFFSVNDQHSNERRADFETSGWTTHTRPIEIVKTHAGEKKRANIDSLLLFHAGLLCSRSRADTVVLASGDGDLVCDLVHALAGLPTARQIVTLSLALSTSWRLNAQRNPHIAANLEVGRDCLRLLHCL